MKESAGLQNALAALATDADWAASVALEPARLRARFVLAPEEAEVLGAISPDDLTRYAQGLLNKRLRGVMKQLPLSLKVCPHLRGWVRDWLVKHPRRGPSELSPGARDALDALPSLCRVVAASELSYLPDLITYEVLLRCSRSDGIERRVRLRFDMASLTASLRAGVIPLEPEPTPNPQEYVFDDAGVHLARGAALVVTQPTYSPSPPRAIAAGFLGAGLGYRSQYREAVRAGPPPVLEVIPDHFFGDPQELAELAQSSALVMHDVLCSFGTVGDDDAFEAHLRRVKELTRYARPALFSDHLAVTRAPNGIDIGHLAPVLLDEAALRRISDRVKRAQDLLQVEVALENIFTPFELAGAIPEPEFFHRLTEATGCGLLLDVTNLLYNARNRREDPRLLLGQYPLSAVRQVHLAGGVQEPSGRWMDSHSHAVEADAFSLLDGLDASGVRALIIERDTRLPPYAELIAEADHACEIWEQRHP